MSDHRALPIRHRARQLYESIAQRFLWRRRVERALAWADASHGTFNLTGEPPAHPSTAETEQEDGSATGRPDRQGSGR